MGLAPVGPNGCSNPAVSVIPVLQFNVQRKTEPTKIFFHEAQNPFRFPTPHELQHVTSACQEAPEPTVLVQPDERDFEGELRRLRESLEAQVRAAQAEAEKQRKRAEEAMQKLQARFEKRPRKARLGEP